MTTNDPTLPATPASAADQRAVYECLMARWASAVTLGPNDPPQSPHQCRFCGTATGVLIEWAHAPGQILDDPVKRVADRINVRRREPR